MTFLNLKLRFVSGRHIKNDPHHPRYVGEPRIIFFQDSSIKIARTENVSMDSQVTHGRINEEKGAMFRTNIK